MVVLVNVGNREERWRQDDGVWFVPKVKKKSWWEKRAWQYRRPPPPAHGLFQTPAWWDLWASRFCCRYQLGNIWLSASVKIWWYAGTVYSKKHSQSICNSCISCDNTIKHLFLLIALCNYPITVLFPFRQLLITTQHSIFILKFARWQLVHTIYPYFCMVCKPI